MIVDSANLNDLNGSNTQQYEKQNKKHTYEFSETQFSFCFTFYLPYKYLSYIFMRTIAIRHFF